MLPDHLRNGLEMAEEFPEEATCPEQDEKGGSNMQATKNPESIRYSTILCNKKPSPRIAKFIVLILFLTTGTLIEYQSSVILDLQEKGATYEDQSNFSLVYYPFFLRWLIAPFMDLFFVERIGKCRTYIVSTCLLIGGFLFVYAPFADQLTQPSRLTEVIIVWLSVNIVGNIYLISAEMWIVKIFEDDNDKAVGMMLWDIGYSLGTFLSYNIFLPLNSVRWLNSNIYAENPVTEPIITHAIMMRIIGGLHFFTAFLVLFFIAEAQSEKRQNLGVKKLFTVILRIVANGNLRKVMIWLVLNRSFLCLFRDSLQLKFVDNGFSKATIANMDTYTLPFYLLFSCLAFRYFKKGKLMRRASYASLYTFVIVGVKFLILADLAHNQNKTRTYYLYMIQSFFNRIDLRGNLSTAFFILITPLSAGSTFITFFMCWYNLCDSVPQTIGYRIIDADVISYNILVFIGLTVQIACTLLTLNLSKTLDHTDKASFDVEQHKHSSNDIIVQAFVLNQGPNRLSEQKSEEEKRPVGESVDAI